MLKYLIKEIKFEPFLFNLNQLNLCELYLSKYELPNKQIRKYAFERNYQIKFICAQWKKNKFLFVIYF